MTDMTHDASAPSASSVPRSWWQWVLIYPTVAVALITAAPTWADAWFAFREGLRITDVDDAVKQHEFWTKNLECTAAPFDWVENPNRIKIDGTICPSGDVMIRLSTPMRGDFIRGIFVEDLIAQQTAWTGPSLMTAHAATRDWPGDWPENWPEPMTRLLEHNDATDRLAQSATVICQKFLRDNRTVLRHIRVGSACYDERVDTYTGQVTSKEAVQCRNTC